MTMLRLRSFVACLVILFLGTLSGLAASGRPSVRSATPQAAVLRRFETNAGQFPVSVRFAARTRQQALLLLADGARLRGSAGSIDLRWGGAAAIAPLEPLPGVTNYLTGRDPSQWHRNVRGYGRVKYTQVAPGIDLEFYSAANGFEYDVLVAPDADPGAFALHVGGGTARVDSGGDLIVEADRGSLRQVRPIAFQTIDGRRVPVDVRYVIRDGAVHLRAGQYDKRRPLVIDPTLEFSTYLGGSGNDFANATAIDGAGNIYVAGSTLSTDFPLAAAMAGDAPGSDAFIAKLTPDGSSLVYSTYLGGSADDYAFGLGVSSAGSAYVTGKTTSTDFPLAAAAQTSTAGPSGAFVARLDPTGSSLIFSTYLGGSGDDAGAALAVDSAGGAYVTGTTTSTDFPIVNGFQTSPGGSFVAKYTAAGARSYASYFGGATNGAFSVALKAIAVDPAGAAYVAGETLSATIPTTAGAFQTTPGTGGCNNPFLFHTPYPCADAVVAKLAPNGQLAYGTYLRELQGSGQGRNDGATAIAVDGSGSAYVTGYTQSPSFPTTPGAYRETCLANGCSDFNLLNSHTGDVFVTKLNAAGSGLVYSTLLGGLQAQAPTAITVDKVGNATVVGATTTSDFPTVNAHQPTTGSGPLLRTTDAGVTWTSLNGPPGRTAERVAVAADGTVYATAYYFGTVPGVGSTSIYGLFKSTNGGASWPQIIADTSGATLSLDPNNASVLYANGARSTDAGATFTPIAALPDGAKPDPLVAPGASNVLYAISGSPNVLYKSTNTGASWAPLNSGLPSSFKIFAAPSAPGTIYAWNDQTLNISIDGGATFTPRTVPGTSVVSMAVDPANAGTLYASYTDGSSGGIARSTDGGATWQTTLPTAGATPRVDGVAPTSPATVFASARNSSGPAAGALYRSTDAAQTWTAVWPLVTGGLFAANPAQPSQGFEINTARLYTDGFVTTLASDGASLVYSSFIGGGASDTPRGVALAPDGAVAVVGETQSVNLPTASALQPANGGATDAFVLKLRYPQPLLAIDTPHDGVTETAAFKISGWALDRGALADCGIDAVHVWAYPSGGSPVFIAAVTPSLSRPDLGALYGSQFGQCGFELPVGNLPSGRYLFALFPHSSVTGTFAAPHTLDVTIARTIVIALNPPAAGARTYRGAKLGGWALDPSALSGTGVDAIHVWAYPNPGSGQAPMFVGLANLGVNRPDVGAIFGSQFDDAGYDLHLPALAPGDYLFVAYPHSTITGGFDPPASVRATIAPPVRISIDTPTAGATIAPGANLGGWAIDLGSETGTGIDAVHVWAYPNPGSGQSPIFVGVASYGVARSDIGGIFGSRFTNAGFNLPLTGLAAGSYMLAVFPHSSVSGGFEAPATVTVTVAGAARR